MSTTERETADEDATRISVVVLSKDEPELASTLRALKDACSDGSVECIVVDASSGRLQSIADEHPWVTWIDFDAPFWRSSTIPHQRNVGCRAAKGEVILFCDAGGLPGANWVDVMAAPLLEGRLHFVCGPILPVDKGVYQTVNDVDDGAQLYAAPTANMAFTKELFTAVGGFNEDLFYGSDIDFCLRCRDRGVLLTAVRAGEITMDWGSTALSRKRSWRYGKAWLRLALLHRRHWRYLVLSQPERLAYPLWLAATPLIVVLAIVSWWPLAVLWPLTLLIPVLRNRREPDLAAVVVDHLIGGAAVLFELLVRAVGRTSPVWMVPIDGSPYVEHLADGLRSIGIPVTSGAPRTKSHTLNVVLAPLAVVVGRLRGLRILHVQWTYPFALNPSIPFAPRISRRWFSLWLWVASTVGVSVVWTAHNLIPHEPVFDDDRRARQRLLRSVAAVVALTPESADELASAFGFRDAVVIPHGPLSIASETMQKPNDVHRSRSKTVIAGLGHLRSYKGFDLLIDAATLLSDASVLVAGSAKPEVAELLRQRSAEAIQRGGDVQLHVGFLADEELAWCLDQADLFAVPFRTVTNSGSIILALAAGIPVIIPDLPSLEWVPSTCAFKFSPDAPIPGITEAVRTWQALDDEARSAMAAAAVSIGREHSWHEIARRTGAVYRRAAGR